MVEDPIVTEVRKRRAEFTRKFGYDPQQIIRYFQKKQATEPDKYVSEIKVVSPGELVGKK